MSEMSYQQARSVASQIVVEMDTIAQQQRALLKIQELLLKAEEAEKLLHGFQKEKKSIEDSLPALRKEAHSITEKSRNDHEALVKTYKAEEEAAKDKAEVARATMKNVEEDLKRAEENYNSRSHELTSKITELEGKYKQVVDAFNAFKTLHRLGE